MKDSVMSTLDLNWLASIHSFERTIFDDSRVLYGFLRLFDLCSLEICVSNSIFEEMLWQPPRY